ncbi:MAG: TetR/AcrR family transcriptional regulator [Acidimicrobiales bacterium]
MPGSGPADDVATRIAQRTLAKRRAGYAGEVRALLDAALDVMRRCGTASRPRVADIVAAAGLSNDAFYRHFPSKDALVTAILEDGRERLSSYLAHQMAKEARPEARVRRWVEGVLSQAVGEVAATTLAVLWNAGSVGEGPASGRHFASAPLAELLREPFAALGSADPVLDASLATHAVLGTLSDHLWRRDEPAPAEVEAVTAFCLRTAAGPGRVTARRARRGPGAPPPAPTATARP